MRRMAAVLIILGFLCAASEPLAIVQGTVTNDLGLPIEGVTVRLRNTMSGSVTQATSDQAGAYLFKTVPQGRYSLWATADGYGSVWVREIVVNAGDHVRHDIRFYRRIPTRTGEPLLDLSARP